MNNTYSLQELRKQYLELVKDLEMDSNVEQYYKNFFTTPQHDGSLHIEQYAAVFDVVRTERGIETLRISGLSSTDVLYHLCKKATWYIAVQYELKNRRDDVDSRFVWYPYQEELMEKLNPGWGERLKQYHQEVLKEHPFDHNSGLRFKYADELKQKGLPHYKIWELAYEKYPLP